MGIAFYGSDGTITLATRVLPGLMIFMNDL